MPKWILTLWYISFNDRKTPNSNKQHQSVGMLHQTLLIDHSIPYYRPPPPIPPPTKLFISYWYLWKLGWPFNYSPVPYQMTVQCSVRFKQNRDGLGMKPSCLFPFENQWCHTEAGKEIVWHLASMESGTCVLVHGTWLLWLSSLVKGCSRSDIFTKFLVSD